MTSNIIAALENEWSSSIVKIRSVLLHNVGRFKELEAKIAPTDEVAGNVTVFIGDNGAGKTAILKSLATSLSWFVARLRSEKGNGAPILNEVIFNGKPSAKIELTVFDKQNQLDKKNQLNSLNADIENYLYQWTLAKTASGKKASFNSELNDATRLAECYRKAYTENDKASVPLIAFYPVERVVLDIPLKIRGKHSFSQLDGYDNALNKGVDFRRFFEWFRDREDAENESGLSQGVLNQLLEQLDESHELWHKLQELKASSRDRQLTAVRTAIANLMPGFSNLRVHRKPRLHISIDKDGEKLNVSQLSQGEKSLMTLVGDIARRLAMMNPALENPLHGEGIILIDEVDMHLHPTWQRSLIQRLTTTFPHCQFILTTHSPLVISDSKDLLVYALDNGEITLVPSQYGQDANSILLDVMHTHIRNAAVGEKLSNLLDLIQKNQFSQARETLDQLDLELPTNNLELIKAKMLLRKREIKDAQNH